MGTTYKRNFLDDVIARVDFATTLPMEESPPTKIAQVALETFPVAEPKQVHLGQLKFAKNGSAVAESNAEWRFYGNEREKAASVAQQGMWVSYKQYKSFDTLQGDFVGILSKLFEVYGEDVVVRRFGLRYINRFHFPEGDPTDWKDFLEHSLLPLPQVVNRSKPQLCRAFHAMELNFDNARLKLQYGMFNPDYPATIRSREYILDMDAFLEGPQEENDVQNNLVKFHELIERTFEGCITPKLREVMNE